MKFRQEQKKKKPSRYERQVNSYRFSVTSDTEMALMSKMKVMDSIRVSIILMNLIFYILFKWVVFDIEKIKRAPSEIESGMGRMAFRCKRRCE